VVGKVKEDSESRELKEDSESRELKEDSESRELKEDSESSEEQPGKVKRRKSNQETYLMQ